MWLLSRSLDIDVQNFHHCGVTWANMLNVFVKFVSSSTLNFEGRNECTPNLFRPSSTHSNHMDSSVKM